mgnify:CR=1 FL=1
MDWVSRIAEDRIREAIERGELRNLPGEGKPLEIEDLSHVPEDLRAAYIMLRNAGVVPEEVQLAKETVTLEDLLRMCRSEEERAGIRKKLKLQPPTNQNIYTMSDAERMEKGIISLPSSLQEALEELKNDDVICEALGEHVLTHFIRAKEIEWEMYRTQVHPWERDQYLTTY